MMLNKRLLSEIIYNKFNIGIENVFVQNWRNNRLFVKHHIKV